jgi:hypothetical protein|nr:hypothetical protein [Kofleriaceae bacterium]
MLQRIVTVAALVIAATAVPAAAKKRAAPPTASMPAVDDALPLTGGDNWPDKQTWLYDVPSPADAAGKIVVHWFCTPKLKDCADDLARLIALRDAGHTYIVAYIDGSKAQAQKLDPIRESEGVGRGTVAYGPSVTKLAKELGVAGKSMSVVVGTDGKVVTVSTGSTADVLDARDKAVTDLAHDIRAFVSIFDGPGKVKAGEKFQLAITIKLASWLTFAQPYRFELTAPKDLQCSARSLAGDQLVVQGRNLVASVTCSAPHGIYEAQGHIQFNYTLPSKEGGVGEDGTTWKFEVVP